MKNRDVRNFRFGFTLIEILLALGLVITILGMLWSMMGMFARTYIITENRVSRSQLVRSISQMLNEDLGAAIQDPVHALAAGGSNAQVRRFGLRGNAVSLQIDVVQPNLFAPAQSSETLPAGGNAANSKAGGDFESGSNGFTGSLSSGGSENLLLSGPISQSDSAARVQRKHQVPELKTIYYEFIPPGRRFHKAQNENETAGSSESNDGSQIVGTLQTPTANDISGNGDQGEFGGLGNGFPENGELTGANEAIGAAVPLPGTPGGLAEKFGLSRRELDFETPPENTAGSGQFIDSEVSESDSKFVGSLQAPPDQGNSELVSIAPGTAGSGSNEFGQTSENTSNSGRTLPLTVSELAMITEDGTMWAPEVVDCRFDYFDGTAWFTEWDSIERSGLPKAIRVSLVLMSLDDVQQLRLSREFFTWSQGREEKRINIDEKGNNESRLIGSLQNSALTSDAAAGLSYAGQNSTAEPIRELSFAELARTLGLSPPMEREVITRVPTTPLAEHKIQQRREPMTRVSGSAAAGKRQNTASEKVVERTVVDRTFNERTASDRTASDRTASERTASDRTASDRMALERTTGERSASERGFQERSIDHRTEDRMNEAFVPEKFSESESAAAPFQERAVPNPMGEASVSTKRQASASQKTGQTWIRGKR